MSQFLRVHTPNSPLLPLSPMAQALPGTYLSPYTTTLRSRRSFTPSQLNLLPPPSLSPICVNLSGKKDVKMRDNCTQMTPDAQALNCSLIFPSTQKSMKKIRSSARIQRKIEARTSRSNVPLTPIRRSLFSEPTPSKIVVDTPKIGRAETGRNQNNRSLALLTPNYHSMPDEHQSLAMLQSSSPLFLNTTSAMSLLDETFTVTSILKEINLEKYAMLFAREEVDLFVFLMLTPDDLIELGIDEDDRDILLNAVRCYTEFFGSPDKMSY